MGVSYLLDTHTFLWLVLDQRRSQRVTEALASSEAETYVSAVSAFEVTTKRRLGKLAEAHDLAHGWERYVALFKARRLEISTEHAVLAGSLDWDHRDPFDRLLAAQAITESMTFVTADRVFAGRPRGLSLLPW